MLSTAPLPHTLFTALLSQLALTTAILPQSMLNTTLLFQITLLLQKALNSALLLQTALNSPPASDRASDTLALSHLQPLLLQTTHLPVLTGLISLPIWFNTVHLPPPQQSSPVSLRPPPPI